MAHMLPMVHPNDLVVGASRRNLRRTRARRTRACAHPAAAGGWDINNMNMADAMARAEVLDYDLQRQVWWALCSTMAIC